MKIRLAILAITASAFCSTTGWCAPEVFPEPQEMTRTGEVFVVDTNISILVPAQASEADLRLANLLAAELSDRHGLAIATQAVESLPSGKRFVLLGTVANPLVKDYAAAQGLEVSAAKPGPEGYVLSANANAVVVAGSDERGAFYGLQSLRQLIESRDGRAQVAGVKIRDWPCTKFRAVKLYLPGPEHIEFFKRFLADYVALYKFNSVMMEMNATMRLDRHPELNLASREFARDMKYRRLNRPLSLWGHEINSSHYDTADGDILEKAQVADIVHWAESHYIEVIPELPSLSHSYYLLAAHRELAEVPQEEWPDTYCPSLPATYKLLFDVYDEYIEVMRPKMIHVGHDEWRMPWGVCPRCRGKDPTELFAQDVNKIHDYLAGKGVRMAMWCDHLLEDVRGAKLQKTGRDANGQDHFIPGALSPEQVERLIPKDILMFNWSWGYTLRSSKTSPLKNEQHLCEWGFDSVYGNLSPSIPNFRERIEASPKIVGGEPSAWLATTEFNFGKDRVGDFASCADMLWTGRNRNAAERSRLLNALMPDIRRNLSGQIPPSATDPVVPVDISRSFNAAAPGIDRTKWRGGRVSRGRLLFNLGSATKDAKFAVVARTRESEDAAYPEQPPAIAIHQDVNSIVFLHALAKKADSLQGYRQIFDFEDSADLLGCYNVEYEDGFVLTVPLRNQWNILDWNNAGNAVMQDDVGDVAVATANRAGAVAYAADALECGDGITFFAFEWTNPRLGKAIKQVWLKASDRFERAQVGDRPPGIVANNAVILAAISVVPRRDKPTQPDPPFPQ